MFISVIVPTLNAEKYIGECLASIRRQGYDAWEVIVMDGGSADKTIEIVKQYQSMCVGQIRLFQGKDKNEPDAINKGFAHVRGQILTWLDADDTYERGAFSRVAEVLRDRKWCYGKCRIIDEHGQEIRSLITKAKEIVQKRYSYKALLCVDFIPQPSCFFRREIVSEIGELNVNERYVFDYDYWLRIGARHRPAYINSYLANWRAHSESASVLDPKKEAKDALRIVQNYSKGLKALQYGVYLGTVGIYGVLKRG